MSSQLPAPANPAHMFVRLRRPIRRGSLVRRQYFNPQTPSLSYSYSALRFSDQLSNYEKNQNLSSVIFQSSQSSLRSSSMKYSSKLLVNPLFVGVNRHSRSRSVKYSSKVLVNRLLIGVNRLSQSRSVKYSSNVPINPSSATIIVPGADPWRIQAQSLLVLDRWHSNSSQSRSVEISSIVLGNPMCSVFDCDFWSRSSERLSAVLSNALSVFISVNKSAPEYGEGGFAKMFDCEVFDRVLEEEFSENNDQHEGLEKSSFNSSVVDQEAVLENGGEELEGSKLSGSIIPSFAPLDINPLNLMMELSKHIRELKSILYGSSEAEPVVEACAQLNQEFFMDNTLHLLINCLPKFNLETHKDATQVVANLQRQQVQSRLVASDYLEANLDLMDILISSYEKTYALEHSPFLEDEISLELKEEDGECYRMLRSRERSYNGNARIVELLLGSDLLKCGVDVNAISHVLCQSCKRALHTNGYYRDEGRKIKAHIERRNLELNIQYCFKVVVHIEFRRDWGEALRMYDDAYHVLRDIVCTSTRLPPIQCVVEIKTIAKQLNFNWQAMAMAAASLAYGSEKKNIEITLVFDLGGGIFDVSVIEVGDGVFEMLSTSGDTHLGGDDFDKRIGDWLASNFKKDEGIDLLELLLKLNGQLELLEFQSH